MCCALKFIQPARKRCGRWSLRQRPKVRPGRVVSATEDRGAARAPVLPSAAGCEAGAVVVAADGDEGGYPRLQLHSFSTSQFQCHICGAGSSMKVRMLKIVEDIIPPDDIGVTFDDIGALDNVKETLKELMMFPLQRSELFFKQQLTKADNKVISLDQQALPP